ncbi:MAG: CoB--CoM heterodisulfide reductase iron-sulfur subunit B family protein [Candidatus Thorarchaeota archaeon]
MTDYFVYVACTTPVRLPAYEAATMAVLKHLGVNAHHMKDVNCCGAQYIESLSRNAFAAMSGRILAVAERFRKDVIAVCGACSGSLKHVKHMLDTEPELKAEVNDILAEEGLEYTGKVEVKHLLQILRDDVGYDAIRKAVVQPYHGVDLAAHYGCHVTRPAEIVQVDDPEVPRVIDEIIEACGADAIDYAGQVRCCGGPMLAMDEQVATKIGSEKIKNVKDSGAKGIVTACVFCNIQLTQVQFGEGGEAKDRIPILTLPQFMGTAMGIDEESLGMPLNKISPDVLLEFAHRIESKVIRREQEAKR